MNAEKDKIKNAVFTLQITESAVKLLRCSFADNQRKRNIVIAVESFSENAPDELVAGAVDRIFKKAGYRNNRLVISLPRNKATVRYLKIPARSAEEIEKIVALQASRLVPYPQEELVTAYQIIGTDHSGFTELNLSIVHKDILERYFTLCKGITRMSLNVVLSSYGLSGLYFYLKPSGAGTVMLIDFDGSQTELVIVGGKTMLFSRSAKIEKDGAAKWEKTLLDEVKRTLDAYADEIQGGKPEKIVVAGTTGRQAEAVRFLKEKSGFQVEALPFEKELNFSPEAVKTASAEQVSAASLAGLVLKSIPVSLNLLPRPLKEKAVRGIRFRQALRLVLFVCAAIVLAGAGLAKSLDNKGRYLSLIEQELKKNEKEASYLADLEYRMRAFEKRLQARPSVLEMLYQLFQVTPAGVSITQFGYEEDKGVILRGQCAEFNSVLELVSALNKEPAYSKSNVKVRFASRKKTPQGEIVDFEIGCVNNRE
ncbi:MAG: pilus assembly protein PilM [Candidatus Omnitrophica bacterium]|nr:pilus assembly protein PilM [Candidatus Omnitrophota bacterium]